MVVKDDCRRTLGFLNGYDDCLTWTAHKHIWTESQKKFSVTWVQLNDMIGKFYTDHPESMDIPVVDVWKKIMENLSPNRVPSAERAETWENPHWYLDGFWWMENSVELRHGFVDGYLWCLTTEIPDSRETYSKSVDFYVQKIDAFTKANANSKLNREKVANILRRYKDNKSNTNLK